MKEQSNENKEKTTLKKRIFAGLGALAFVAIATLKESIQKHLGPLFDGALDWIIKNGGPNLRPFFHFFAAPTTISSGLLLCFLVILSAISLLILFGNLWVTWRGPKVTDYTTDEFCGYRWSWEWAKPEKGTRYGAIENLVLCHSLILG